jgi:hypothetical protein
MTDTAAEVVIKAEYHNSTADLREGRKLLEEGVDHFIFEAPKEQAEYPLRHRWFQILMWLFNYFIMNRFVYTDHSVLKDIADRYEADKIPTRKANSRLINDAPWGDVATSFAVFATLLIGSILIGILYDRLWIMFAGSIVFTGGMTVPVLLLRVAESDRENNNRDEKIAREIVAAAEKGERIVAILGESHCNPVIKKLPKRIEPDFYPTSYNRRHPRQILNNLKLVTIAFPLYVSSYFAFIFILKAVVGSI